MSSLMPRRSRPAALALAGAAAAFAAGPALRAADEAGLDYAHLTVAATTDMHGHIYPIDYYTNREVQLGVAKVASVVATLRLEAPHLLLLDSGDTIQGTPLEYYHNRVDNAPPDPMMLAMNALRYDAMAVGNHDYNYGLQVQDKARGEASFPWLSANTYEKATGQNRFQPYLIKVVDGVRVGILGLTTPDIPLWDNAANYAGVEFRDPVPEARKWVRILREQEKADVVIVAMHMGLERDLATGQMPPFQLSRENSSIEIAESIPGIDLILLGHTHKEIPSLTINGVLLTQANYWADHVARADLYLKRSAGGPWRVWAKQAATIPITRQTEADPKILGLAASYEQATQAWLDRKIGTCDQELTAQDATLRSTAIIDLIQRAELEQGNADVALSSVLNAAARIPKGAVSVRDICSLYVYDNTLLVVEITGAQLKDALEHAARYFKAYSPGKTPAELMDYRIPQYNFDMAAGVNYVIDLTRPPGDRVRDLQFQGAPLDPARKLRVATNNYRVAGGGNFESLKNAPVVFRSSEEIRNLVIDWVEKHHQIPTEPMNNWRIVP